jgi:lipopolysaccharide/colanic/teichoic acid biosynthesis glycosyltransferase
VSPPPAVDQAVRSVDQAVKFLPSAFEHPAERVDAERGARAWPLLKRTFDALFAAALLIAMLPLLIVIAIAIKLDSRGPIFYRVRRVGYQGRPLLMLKFRKMHDDAQGGPLTAAADPRLTRVGALLTSSRLDELPQLWDVLRGRMSIIGPRPEDPVFVALHAERYNTIHAVRPGITGITQLAFADESHILDKHDPIGDYVNRILPSKLQLDAFYAQRNHLRLDAAVLFWTIAAVIMHRPVAVNRATGRMNTRRRPTAPRSSPECAPRRSPRVHATASEQRLRGARGFLAPRWSRRNSVNCPRFLGDLGRWRIWKD